MNDVPRINRRAYRVLAALLLADGEWVSARVLALGLFKRPLAPQTIRKYIWQLQRAGVMVVRQWRNGNSRGYRLTRLPPDEHLDLMLAMVADVKRSAWWRERSAWRQTA